MRDVGVERAPFPDHFSAAAALYAATRPKYPSGLFSLIAQLAPRCLRAWDCGTGNGQAAVALADCFDEVSATDASAQQLLEAPTHPKVKYSLQRSEETDFASGSFDAICVAQALHWFEFKAFFAEVERVAAPGAVFAAWGYDSSRIDPVFDAALERAILEPIDAYWAPQNRLLWSGYAEVPIPFSRLAAPRFEVKVNWNLHQFLAYVETWSATRRSIEARGRGFLAAAEVELARHWGEPETAREVRMPLHLVLARVS